MITTDAYVNRVDGWSAVTITVAGIRLSCQRVHPRRLQWSFAVRGRHVWNMTWWRS